VKYSSTEDDACTADGTNTITFVITPSATAAAAAAVNAPLLGNPIKSTFGEKFVLDLTGTGTRVDFNKNNFTHVSGGSTALVNLSNQLEYIFEVKTQEHDPTSELRPIL
jgi:hypothetical protein